jgi:hypothetical protein
VTGVQTCALPIFPCHHGMARPQVADVRWVPCHHGMAHPQVADVRCVPCHRGMALPQVADVRGVPCHRGMALPQVADGGNALHLWRKVANILNKQSRTADKGWSSSLGVGRGANISSPQENNLVTKTFTKPRTWTDSLDKRPKRKKMAS